MRDADQLREYEKFCDRVAEVGGLQAWGELRDEIEIWRAALLRYEAVNRTTGANHLCVYGTCKVLGGR